MNEQDPDLVYLKEQIEKLKEDVAKLKEVIHRNSYHKIPDRY